MGQSGYFVGHRPLLYDRETESLWVERDEAMTAVAGRRKGASLPRIARVAPVAWGDWQARHPREPAPDRRRPVDGRAGRRPDRRWHLDARVPGR